MSFFPRDLRFAFRQLGKAPGFTSTIVLTLALGIGATTAIFSLIEGILLRPLPFSDPDRLVLLGDHVGNGPGVGVTGPRNRYLLRRNHGIFIARRLYRDASFELSGGATA